MQFMVFIKQTTCEGIMKNKILIYDEANF